MNQFNQITTQDKGLGTTYERWALNRFLLTVFKDKEIKTVFEGPGDGMTGIAGINSLILAMNVMQVTLILPKSDQAHFANQVWSHYLSGKEVTWKIIQSDFLTLEREKFDLVWNFNVMTQQDNPANLLEKMCCLSHRYVLIFVPNRQNYSFPLHRLHHKVAKQPWDHGDIALMHPEIWRNMFAQLKFHCFEPVWVDCPWWPDIVDIGQLVEDFFPFLKGIAQRAKPSNRYAWDANNLPYYETEQVSEINRRMTGLAYFENSRITWVKKIFAHHVGILARRIESE